MPVNAKGERMSPSQYNRNDGFSPGSAIILHVTGLDNAAAFAKTNPVGVLNIGAEFARNQPIVVIDQATGRRQLVYARARRQREHTADHRSDDPPRQGVH